MFSITSSLRSLTLPAGLLLLSLAACSNNGDSNPMDSTPTPAFPTDQVTVTFNSLTAVLDCDGPDNPGDFYYSLNVDTADLSGNWYTITSNGEQSATLSNGVTRMAPFGVTFTMPRYRYSQFRVRMTLRESDGATNDFSKSTTYTHRYNEDNQAWAGNWNKTTRRGHENWTLNIRARETNWIGGVTEEGCYTEMTYTVVASENQ